MADPGYSVGGRETRRGDVDSRGSYVSKILYVKTKESGPFGGVPGAHPLDPPMHSKIGSIVKAMKIQLRIVSCMTTQN